MFLGCDRSRRFEVIKPFLSKPEAIGENTVVAAIIHDADLHDHLTKGLYEMKLSA